MSQKLRKFIVTRVPERAKFTGIKPGMYAEEREVRLLPAIVKKPDGLIMVAIRGWTFWWREVDLLKISL